MSTRSGKRIHSSLHDNTLKPTLEHEVQSERKTRTRRIKENPEDSCASDVKTKKRTNYVTYPTDDETGTDTRNSNEVEAKPTRLLKNNALKELNPATSESDGTNTTIEVFKPLRTTRSTRKYNEESGHGQENQNHVEEVVMKNLKPKKEKKKKKSIPENEVDENVVSKKKTKKKQKKGKTSGSMVIEDIEPVKNVKVTSNMSMLSGESFYSATGSLVASSEDIPPLDMVSSPNTHSQPLTLKPAKNSDATLTNKHEVRQTRSNARLSSVTTSQSTSNNLVRVSRKRKSSINSMKSPNMNDNDAELQEFDTTLTNTSKKCKSSIKNTAVPEKNADVTFDAEVKNSTFDLEDLEKRKSVIKAALVNTTFDKFEPEITDTTFDKNEVDKNSTYDKELTASTSNILSPQPVLNSTYEKETKNSEFKVSVNTVLENSVRKITFDKDTTNEYVTRKSEIINTTYEKDSDTDKKTTNRRTASVINETFDKNISSDMSEVAETEIKTKIGQNSTFDKNEKSDSTFDKDKKLDTTFDKNSKSSLISLDTSNVTLDKSDTSRISITSDDSRENIVNTTPVLIGSSLDESKISTSSVRSNPLTPVAKNTSKVSPKTPTPVTPLKREGTFTKDDSLFDISRLPTPERKMSLPSPGRTPFPAPKSGTKLLNVTCSVEKTRRSSLAEPLPRATRVMFCSPVNNPELVMQQKKRVIKSNLKGSNKSFVFEDSASSERPSVRRKRSYTHNDVEETRAKRTRVDSASRGRTHSAGPAGTAKAEPTPSCSKGDKAECRVARTRLPNFAALHQKEFSKMESLDECQRRRARRARHLLTPTGTVKVLQRTSLTDNDTETSKKSPNEEKTELRGDKSKKDKDTKQTKKQRGPESSKKEKDVEQMPKEIKKPDTPVKSLPTLKSLNPGYTRFGFKLNYDVNPFSVTTNTNTGLIQSNKKNTDKKDNTKPLKDIKSLKRQTALPSLVGTTRKDVAKQTVMREKSFTEKRSLVRNENRTVIKGVRTNRRFELQMRMRNME